MRQSPLSSMSDNSESGSDDAKANGNPDDICRDFLRNVCKRGRRCRYRHPYQNEANANELPSKKHDYTFCHDFQNSGCRRQNCKFLHCTREEEEYYKQTSQLPVRLQQAAALGIGVAPTELPLLRGEVPICKDFLKGDCKRGNKCKFRHLSVSEYEFELRKPDHRNGSFNNGSSNFSDNTYDRYDSYDYNPSHSAAKRRRSDYDEFSGFDEHFHSNRDGVKPLCYQLLEEENTILRRKLDDLKKQVADLTATNEVLLEQNARYRVSKSNSATHSINIPTQGAPLSQLNASLAQQIALNSEIASQHAATLQRLSRELAQPAQGTLPAPAIDRTVPLNPPPLVQGSLAQANMSAVSLAPAPVSIPQSFPPSSQSMPQKIVTPSTPLITYPIASQNMRMAPSSLAH